MIPQNRSKVTVYIPVAVYLIKKKYDEGQEPKDNFNPYTPNPHLLFPSLTKWKSYNKHQKILKLVSCQWHRNGWDQ